MFYGYISKKPNLTMLSKIGSGRFGDVYYGYCNESGREVAIKKETSHGTGSLNNETKILRTMNGFVGIPQYYSSYFYKGSSVLAQTLLGENLESLFQKCGKRFSLKTTYMLADQMISRIEALHKKNFVHRDITPTNFMIGRAFNHQKKAEKVNYENSNQSNTVFIIDFGLTTEYRNPFNQEHIPMQEEKPFLGTARYASVNVHMGKEVSRRDDLESLAYILIYFAKGSLPWQGIKTRNKKKKYDLSLEKKLSFDNGELFKGLPEEFEIFLKAVRKLEFQEEPNYAFYRKLFRNALINMGEIYDYKFDWIIQRGQLSTHLSDSNGNLKINHPTRPLVIVPNVNIKKIKSFGLSNMSRINSLVYSRKRIF